MLTITEEPPLPVRLVLLFAGLHQEPADAQAEEPAAVVEDLTREAADTAEEPAQVAQEPGTVESVARML